MTRTQLTCSSSPRPASPCLPVFKVAALSVGNSDSHDLRKFFDRCIRHYDCIRCSSFNNCWVWVLQPSAKVWASGFASALLPRRKATSELTQNVHAWMELFFEQWLKGSPGKRLQQLAAVLQQYQTFPQLYIYSESDHVVPHTSVEAFMEVRFSRSGLSSERRLQCFSRGQ